MDGVFSVVAHSALQYLPDAVMQEHSGCAHFSAFGVVIFFSWVEILNEERIIRILVYGRKRFCAERNTLR
jgi:hypothetical protein